MAISPSKERELLAGIPAIDSDVSDDTLANKQASVAGVEEEESITVPEQNQDVHEDFLEDKEVKTISGMEGTAPDDEHDEALDRISNASRRLSTVARSWGNSISGTSNESGSIKRSTDPSVVDMLKRESIRLVTEVENGPKEKDRATRVSISRTVQQKEIPKDMSERSQMDFSPSSINFADTDQEDFDEFFDFDNEPDYVLKHESLPSVHEESEPSIVVEQEEVLDRSPYYDQYDEILSELVVNRIRNNLLQKLLIKLFRRRKVEHYLKDVEPPLDQIIKYGKKLDTYKHLIEINDFERNIVGGEVKSLRIARDRKNEELKKLFKDMQSKEQNVGTGLIYSKTGNQIPDKLVERFIRRQTTQANQVATMRLKFIKLKGMVQEKQTAIEKLDTIEGNLHLTDYEQLKNENRTYADKLEEKDMELARLRTKCQNTIQILAHMREKTAALDLDVFDLKEEYQNVEYQVGDFREHLAHLKHSRDRYRQMSNKIQDESGLLTKPDLLIDMENSQEQLQQLEMELNKCKKDVAKKTNGVRKLREKIEELTEESKMKSKSKQSTRSHLVKNSKSVTHEKPNNIYLNRPTLYMPVIKQEMFDDLVKIKPTAKMANRKRR